MEMENGNSMGRLPGEANPVDCPPDARRRKMDPEIQINAILAAQARKLRKTLPPPTATTTACGPVQPQVVHGGAESTEEDEALQAFTAALDAACGGEDIPESTPENAPFDLVLDFMAAIMKEDFEEGIKLANMVLNYEPTNTTISEYLPILQELIQLRQEESDSSYTTDSDDSDSESCSAVSEESEESSDSVTEDVTRDDDDADVTSAESESTVASDEYLSEYGEDYVHPAEVDDGLKSSVTGAEAQPEQESKEEE